MSLSERDVLLVVAECV